MTMPEGLERRLVKLGILEEPTPPADSKPHRLGSAKYLRRLSSAFPISLIYYPGCGSDDNSLEGAFQKSEIVYLDKWEGELVDLKPDPKQESYSPRNLIYAKAEKAPFSDEAFDAVFIQDLHPTNMELSDILRTLRMGGILIFSTNDCGDYDGDEVVLNDLKKHPQLSQLKLRFSSRYYKSFQKITPQNLP